VWVVLLLPALAAAVSTWKEYTPEVPGWCVGVYELALNGGGEGYAFIHDGYNNGRQYVLKLQNGVWTPGVPPPVHIGASSIAADGTVYAVDDRWSGVVYRFEGGSWEKVGFPEQFGLRVFEGVAAVDRREFWAYGTTVRGAVIVVYFLDDRPLRIFDLGKLVQAGHWSCAEIAVPRAASPSGDCYFAVQASDNPFNSNRWMLYILRTNGTFAGYPFPLNNYYCDGLTAYQPGDVRIMLTAEGAPSRLYGFAGGVFREIIAFPERVVMESQPTPADGWGYNPPNNKIYHWSAGALTPAVDIDGDVSCLDMVSATEGWAGGLKTVNGVRTPAMWYYSDEDALTPTSLGRVKAAFR